MIVSVGTGIPGHSVFVTATPDENNVGGLFEYYRNGTDWAWQIHGHPPGTKIATAPSDTIGRDKLFVGTQNGHLFQHWLDPQTNRWVWIDHGTPPGTVVQSAPGATMSTGSVFVVGEDHNLYQLWYDPSILTWIWVSHGQPGVPLTTAPGAAMMDSKLFVGGENGHLFQRYYVGNGQWEWTDQGPPPGTTVATNPGAAMMDSKLFVGGGNGHLFQLYWDSTSNDWLWTDQGTPPNTTVASAPGAAINNNKLFVAGGNGHLFQLWYNDNKQDWEWIDEETPPPGVILTSAPVALDSARVFVAGNFGQLAQLQWNDTDQQWDWDPVSTIPNINRVFVLMLENRSFDHMLGFSGITGTDASTGQQTEINGLTGTESNSNCRVRSGAETQILDPGHNFDDVVTQLCGEGAVYQPGQYPPIDNSGFVADWKTVKGVEFPCEIMQCQNVDQVPALTLLAQNYAVCDNWFSSMPGPTWPNRFFVHGASSGGLDHSPGVFEIIDWDEFAGFKFQNGSIFDLLANYDLDYNAYCGVTFPQIMALPAFHDHARWSLEEFTSDIQAGGYSTPYTFLEPDYGPYYLLGIYLDGNSEHPTDGVAGGEGWIFQTFMTFRFSDIWNNSLFIVTYDEHGGFYDHVAPPAAVPPGDKEMQNDVNEHGFTFDQYGVRVPTVVISPYIPQNVIDHRIYDHTSILATIEAIFGLPALTQRDANANNFLPLLSLRTPRTDILVLPKPVKRPIQVPDDALIAKQLSDPTPLDSMRKDDNLGGFLFVAFMMDLKFSPTAEHPAIQARVRSLRTAGEARQYMVEVERRVKAAEAGKPPKHNS